MPQPRSLDDVLLSVPAATAWHQVCQQAAPIIGKFIAPGGDIPDEQCEEVEGGALRIFVKLSGDMEVSLTVPAGHWAFRPDVTN